MLRIHIKRDRFDDNMAPESRPSVSAMLEENAAHIGQRNSEGLFYAACSRDFDPDPCGCPICREAQHRGAA